LWKLKAVFASIYLFLSLSISSFCKTILPNAKLFFGKKLTYERNFVAILIPEIIQKGEDNIDFSAWL